MLLLLSSWLIHVPMTMRLCTSHLPEEHFVCYQTSQHNWVVIKVLYRCLRRYMLGWRISRLGFVTLIVGEVSLGPLGNAHHYKPCKQCDQWVGYGMMHYVTSKETCRWRDWTRYWIPTIESRASNIPMIKGTTYTVMRSDRERSL